MNIGLILLAAGNSSRMGSPKQLLFYNGKTFLRRAAEIAIESGCVPVVIVLGHDAARMQREIEDLPVVIAINADWQTGMGSSIRVGIGHLEKIPAVEATLITLCDQPRINAADLRRLITAHPEKPGSIIAASYRQTLGVPAVFPRRFFPDLKQLLPTSGAKQMLMKNESDVIAVPMDEAAIDIDTPDDFKSL